MFLKSFKILFYLKKKNDYLLPFCQELCPHLNEDLKLSADDCIKLLNIALRKYFTEVTRIFCLIIKPSSLVLKVGNQSVLAQINIDMQKLLSVLKPEIINMNEFKFYDRNNSIDKIKDVHVKGLTTGICYYCKLADFNDKDSDKNLMVTDEMKLKNKYSKCVSKFGKNNVENDSNSGLFKLDSNFYKKYSRIKYFGLRDTMLDKENKFDKMKYLVDIQLDNTGLTQIPETVLKMKNLLSLSIRNDTISSLNKETFLALKNLQTLEIENLRLNFKKDEDLLELPVSIKILISRSFSVSFMPLNFKNCDKSITSLTFTGMAWIDTSAYAPFKMWSISKENFMKNFEKIFTKDQLFSLFRFFDVNKDDSLNPEEVVNFNSYIFKKFQRITDFPSIIFNLTNLTRLDLSYQSIVSIPDGIENLKNLNRLYLRHCILLKDISPKVSNLPLKKLELTGCITLKTPPPEIVNRGLVSVLSYLKRLLLGSVLCKKTKLMLVINWFS